MTGVESKPELSQNQSTDCFSFANFIRLESFQLFEYSRVKSVHWIHSKIKHQIREKESINQNENIFQKCLWLRKLTFY